MTSPDLSSRWVQPLMALIAALALIGLTPHYIQTGINAISRPASSDFYKFYLSAQRVRSGASMYWLAPPRERRGDACHPDTPDTERQQAMPPSGALTLGGETPCLGPNLNPPVFMAILLPLSLLPYGAAWWIWAAFSVICATYGAWLLAGHFSGSSNARVFRTLLGSAALFTYYPTLANFSLGQVGTLLLPVLILSWRHLRHDEGIRAGCWLGLALAIKPFLGVLLLGLVVAGQRRAALSMVINGLAWTVVGVLLFGRTALHDYALVAANVRWTATNWNGSWFGFVDRAFISTPDSGWPDTRPLAQALGSAGALTTITLMLWRVKVQNQASRLKGADTIFALGLPAALLASPLGWVYYFPALALSGLITWSHIAPGLMRSRQRLGLMLPMLMSMVPITLQPSPSPLNPAQWLGIDAWYFWTLLIMLLASNVVMRQQNARA